MEKYKFTIAIIIVCLFAAILVLFPVGYITQDSIMLAAGAVLALITVLSCIALIAITN